MSMYHGWQLPASDNPDTDADYQSGKREPICVVDVDDGATYIGDERDGVYFDVVEGPGGWYMTAFVDCGSSSFVEDLVEDDGPYETEEAARQAGRNAAGDWCAYNGVDYGGGDDA